MFLRLSLLAQTEALQNECVKKMYDNDKLNEKVCSGDMDITCHSVTLSELCWTNELEVLWQYTEILEM